MLNKNSNKIDFTKYTSKHKFQALKQRLKGDMDIQTNGYLVNRRNPKFEMKNLSI